MNSITKEMLEEKLVLLNKEYQQLLANEKAYEGAIQVCKQLLTQLETPETND